MKTKLKITNIGTTYEAAIEMHILNEDVQCHFLFSIAAISESEEEKNTQQQSNTTTVTTSMQEVTSNGDEVTITSTDIPTVLISQT